MGASAAHILFVANGMIYRARLILQKTPKPWPKETRQANKLLAQAQGMLTDYWKELGYDERSAAVLATQATTANKVVRPDTSRSRAHDERQLGFPADGDSGHLQYPPLD